MTVNSAQSSWLHLVSHQLSLSPSLRGVLWQSGGAEGANEDGPLYGVSRACELPAERSGPWCGAETLQLAAGTGHGKRHF